MGRRIKTISSKRCVYYNIHISLDKENIEYLKENGGTGKKSDFNKLLTKLREKEITLKAMLIIIEEKDEDYVFYAKHIKPSIQIFKGLGILKN